MKLYVRLNNSVFDENYLLLSEENLQENIEKFPKNDWYYSIYYYNQEQFNKWSETGTIKGITDVITNKLIFDFDCEDDIDKAKIDAIEVVNRLQYLVEIPLKDIEIYFSGGKGFHVVTTLNRYINPYQLRIAAQNIGEGLPTQDFRVYNASRIFRVPFTKHRSSGLYKIPLTFEELKTHSVEQIKSNAKDLTHINIECLNSADTVNIAESWFNSKAQTKEIVQVEECLSDIDYSKKPKWLSNCRWALQNGYFEKGERNSAFLTLAATYKNNGFSLEHVYRLLKGVAEIQSQRNNCDRYSDKELYNNVVLQVFSPQWKGGQFSCKQEGTYLYNYCKSLGSNSCMKDQKDKPILMGDITDSFKDFCKHIDENTILTGIKALDDTFPMQVGSGICLLGGSGSGKCLGKDTAIRMYDGSVKMSQDIKVGDVLMGDDSTPRNVLSTCFGRELLYEVQQDYGDNYVVNKSHIISLMCSYDKKKNGKILSTIKKGTKVDIEISDYINKSKPYKKIFKGYKVAVEYKEIELKLEPYFLGYWLGNGTSNKPQLSYNKKDTEISKYLINFAENNKLNYVEHLDNSANGITVDLIRDKKSFQENTLTGLLRSLNVFKNKHIPNNFLINSKNNRLQLLAGLLDSDGYYDKHKNTYEFSCKQKVFAYQVVDLVRSLGFYCSVKKELKTWDSFTKGKKYKGADFYYRLYISGCGLETIPCLIARKKAKKVNRTTNSLLSNLKLKDIGIGDYYGFEIDGNKRFLLQDYTVTHNTSLLLQILNNTSNSGVKSIFASLDMAKLRLTEKVMYKLSGLSRKELYDTFKNDKELELVNKFKEEFKNTYFLNRSSPTVEDIKNYITDCQDQCGEKIKLVAIDYFERLSSDFEDDTAASKKVAGELQDLVNDMGICLLTLYQPNKQGLHLGMSSPLLDYTKIKGSSFVYQAQRQIFSLWRPFCDTGDFRDDKYLQMACLKNDLGELHRYNFGWNGKRGEIKELSSIEEDELKEKLAEKDKKLAEKKPWG